MITYNELERLYHHKIGKSKNFNEYINSLLKEHFEENTIIGLMYDSRNEKNNFISEEEVQLQVKNQELCEEILLQCSKNNINKIENLLFEFQKNNSELNDIYGEYYYKLGIKDAKSFRKFSLKI